MLRITLVKSPIGAPEDQRATCRALGLTRLNRSVELQDTPAVRGMAAKIWHLVRVEEIGPARATDERVTDERATDERTRDKRAPASAKAALAGAGEAKGGRVR